MTEIHQQQSPDDPLVSVIIPLYNAEEYVRDAIESITRQSYKNLEVIVVNDGSNDNSSFIVEGLAENDTRIKLFHQENKGQCPAANYGFNKSSGDYIKFFDADDLLSPDAIKNQVTSLAGKDEFAASYIHYLRFYDDDLSTTNRYKFPPLIDYDCLPIDYITFHGSPQMYQCGIWLFHRKIFKFSGLWDERLSLINDTEFFPRVLKYCKNLFYAKGPVLYYRTNFKSGTLSQNVSAKSMRSALTSIDLMAKHVRSLERSERVEKIIAQTYVQSLEMSYPSQPKWAKLFERRIKQFPKEYYNFSQSGKIYNFLRKVFGWKLARRVQAFYYSRHDRK